MLMGKESSHILSCYVYDTHHQSSVRHGLAAHNYILQQSETKYVSPLEGGETLHRIEGIGMLFAQYSLSRVNCLLHELRRLFLPAKITIFYHKIVHRPEDNGMLFTLGSPVLPQLYQRTLHHQMLREFVFRL